VKAAPGEGDTRILNGLSPSFLFLYGLALSPSLWLQARLEVKAAQALLLFALAAWSRPRRWWRSGLASLAFVAVTAVVNLAVPLGRVLLRLGPVAVTEGALSSGLAKGLTLVGLAYLSRLCVRPGLILPGAVGRYVSRTFFYLNRLLARGLRPAGFAEGLERALAERYVEVPGASGPGGAVSMAAARPAGPARQWKTAAAFSLLGVFAAANYAFLFGLLGAA
jgi:hypothetical protein